ncbi:MAG: ester cyclase [Bacteroidota bacterium]
MMKILAITTLMCLGVLLGQAQTTEATQLVNRFAELVNEHNFEAIGEIVTDDYKQHNPMVEQGLKGLQNGFQWFLSIFPDMQCNVESITHENGIVAVRFKWTGTQKSEFMGFEASGESLTWHSADWWRIENGKFVEHWDVIDLSSVLLSKKK